MKVVPLNDKIVVKRLEAEEKTAGGIVLPDSAKEKPKQGWFGYFFSSKPAASDDDVYNGEELRQIHRVMFCSFC